MKFNTGEFRDIYDGMRLPGLGRALRELVRDLERAFSKIRVDDSLIIGGGTLIKKHVSVTTTWDPGSLADGAAEGKNVTVTGLALDGNWTCVASLDSLTDANWIVSAFPSGANEVRVVIVNHTGGTVDLDEGTLRVDAWQHEG